MNYLKTTFESAEYNAVNGFENGNQKLQLIEDSNGDYYVNISVKDNPAFAEILNDLNKMEVVNEIFVKENIEI